MKKILKRTTRVSGEIWGNLYSRERNLHQTFGDDKIPENVVYYLNISQYKLILMLMFIKLQLDVIILNLNILSL